MHIEYLEHELTFALTQASMMQVNRSTLPISIRTLAHTRTMRGRQQYPRCTPHAQSAGAIKKLHLIYQRSASSVIGEARRPTRDSSIAPSSWQRSALLEWSRMAGHAQWPSSEERERETADESRLEPRDPWSPLKPTAHRWRAASGERVLTRLPWGHWHYINWRWLAHRRLYAAPLKHQYPTQTSIDSRANQIQWRRAGLQSDGGHKRNYIVSEQNGDEVLLEISNTIVVQFDCL